MTTFYSQPCCPACVCTSQSTGPGSPHGALKVTSILCLQAEAGSLLPCLNKKKKGKDGEEKPCPAWARREKHHLDVRVCPLPGLMKAEGSADLTEWAVSCLQEALLQPCRALSPQQLKDKLLLITSLISFHGTSFPTCLLLVSSFSFFPKMTISCVLLMLTQTCWEFFVIPQGCSQYCCKRTIEKSYIALFRPAPFAT